MMELAMPININLESVEELHTLRYEYSIHDRSIIKWIFVVKDTGEPWG